MPRPLRVTVFVNSHPAEVATSITNELRPRLQVVTTDGKRS